MKSDIAINENIKSSGEQNVAGDFCYLMLRKMTDTLFRCFRKLFVSSIAEIHQYVLPAGVFCTNGKIKSKFFISYVVESNAS